MNATDDTPALRLPFPIAVVSDLHLGHPASYVTDPQMLEPLLAGLGTLVVNGDAFEQLNLYRRRLAREKLGQLVDLCMNRGVHPFFITGNHDPYVSTCHYLDLCGGAIFITHGDALHPNIAPWSKDAATLRAERRRLLHGEREPETLDDVLSLTKRMSLVASLYDRVTPDGWIARVELVSRFARKPWRILRTLRYWSKVARYSRTLRERFRPHARLMLIGHTHRAGVWPNEEFTLVNTGAYMPLAARLGVWIDEREARIRQVARVGNGFGWGRELRRVPIPENAKWMPAFASAPSP